MNASNLCRAKSLRWSLLAAALSLSAFAAACGSDPSTDGDNDPAVTSTASPTEPSDVSPSSGGAPSGEPEPSPEPGDDDAMGQGGSTTEEPEPMMGEPSPSAEPQVVPEPEPAEPVSEPEPQVLPIDAGVEPEPSPEPDVSGPVPAQPTTACEFDITAEISEVIGSVGIVTFTTDLGPVDAGQIEFGETEDYGMVAPLDLEAPGYRTLLLGMVEQTVYHYRLVVQSGSDICVSSDAEILTGTRPPEVGLPTLSPPIVEGAETGFLVTSSQSGGGGTPTGWVVIYDKQARPVWWYRSPITGVTRARMSWDGKSIFARDGNPAGSQPGQVVRISMDGLELEPIEVPTGHHDMSVTPDNGVLFFTSDGSDNCDNVTKRSADGTLTPLYDVRQAFGDAFSGGIQDPCHCNSIHYHEQDDTITFSCLNQNAYVKITQSGELLWVLGGNNGQSHFEGDGSEWLRQHGHDLVADNRLVFFNNGGGMMAGTSLAIEVELDFENMTATRVWTYDGDNSSQTLGDVQRLPNGNTLVTYCNAGAIHEVDSAGELVQSWTFSNGVGYVDHRSSLYGPPDNP